MRCSLTVDGPFTCSCVQAGAVLSDQQWFIYNKAVKEYWDISQEDYVEIRYAGGFAMSGSLLGQGAERAVFAATELMAGLDDRAHTAIACGNSLVAKETLYEEELLNYSFHLKFCQTQVHYRVPPWVYVVVWSANYLLRRCECCWHAPHRRRPRSSHTSSTVAWACRRRDATCRFISCRVLFTPSLTTTSSIQAARPRCWWSRC